MSIRHFLFVIVLIVSDQISKWIAHYTLAYNISVPFIPPFIDFHLIYNRGAAYGILEGQRWLLLAIAFAVVIVIMNTHKKIAKTPIAKVGLALLLAGTIGNTIDRLYMGYVIDFINIHIIPIFNFADVFINIGIICLIIDTVQGSHDHHRAS